METLRIAIITETLPPAQLNLQPWRYLGRLARSLQQEGHEAFAVTTEEGLPSWNGVPVVRHPERGDFRTARGLRRLLQDHNADGGVVRMTASLFFSMRQSTPPAASRGRLIGVFLRPLHGGPDLARRFLDPDLASETLLDMHHAALYASRKLGTWREASGYVDEFVFLWESDRLSAVWAGLAAGSSHVVRHPFDPSFRDRTPAPLGERLSLDLPPVAAGLPVVTTRVHPIRELEERTGLVFARPRNPADLAGAVRTALEDGRRQELARKNEAWMRETPDWPSIAKTYVSFVKR